ncbi:MAG: CPBP family intramembrane glutamic endopeptidase [Thermoplasmata archaeon]
MPPTIVNEMHCTRCGVEFEGAYCPNCGAPAKAPASRVETRCPRCGRLIRGSFCSYCGLQLTSTGPVIYQYTAPTRSGDNLGRMFTGSMILYFGIFLTAVLIYIGLLWGGLSEIVPGILDDACADCKMALLIITPAPIPILQPFGGPPFLIYYLFVVVIISSCFFWLFYKDMPVVMADFKKALKKGWFSVRSKSTLLRIGQLFAFGIFFNVGYNLVILILFGEGVLPTETEIGPPWFFLSLVSSAAVWEELISRTLLIGVPLFMIALAKNKKVDRPLRYFIGGGFELGALELTFLVFSAIMFGAAHIFSGGPWVFPPLFVGGLILGYLFLRKGIIASIMFHFIWNYNIALNYLASVTGNQPLLILGVVFTLFVALVGLVLTVTFMMRVFRTAQSTARTLEAGQGQPGAQVQMSQQAPQTEYTCPRCGWRAATYRDGHFQCLRCGHIT